jgi:hypothetical protein
MYVHIEYIYIYNKHVLYVCVCVLFREGTVLCKNRPEQRN